MGTHVVDLTDSTIDANKRFFAHREDVPKQAITLGMGGIMRAQKVDLARVRRGQGRTRCAPMVKGDIDPKCPASILQVHARNVAVLLDREAAASKL